MSYAMAVECDRSGQDDKEHDHIRKKRTDAHIDIPQPKFFGGCSSSLSKRILTRRLFLFNLFARLPEKQIWTDRGAENGHQHGPFIPVVWHRRDERIAQYLSPISAHHKCGYRIGEEH